MKHTLILGALPLATTVTAAQPFEPCVWPDATPENCPVAKSDRFVDVRFTGRHAAYTDADTWYPSWGADGRMYSPFTDGTVNGFWVGSGHTENPAVGHAIIVGDDPLALTVIEPGRIFGDPAPYGGRYPSANLHHDGIWYLGTYGLANVPGGPWGICGPFAGFHISSDNGKTWTPSPRSCDPENGVFPEPEKFEGPVKFAAPHVVDFGQNMEHSPDGKMYMVAHGATQWEGVDRIANCGWLTGDQIYLCRVTPSPETVNDGRHYEYFGGHDAAGRALWTKELAQARPVLDWNNQCGIVTITFNAPLKKYFMCVTAAAETSGPAKYDTYILESDDMTGPWKMITYMKEFGVQAYFVNIPSRFIRDDGKTMWLCYSANYTDLNQAREGKPPLMEANPPGSKYAMVLQEISLVEERTGDP